MKSPTGGGPGRVHAKAQPVIDFRSDNVASVRPEIIAATLDSNSGAATPYGDDQVSAMLNDRFSEVFEARVTVSDWLRYRGECSRSLDTNAT